MTINNKSNTVLSYGLPTQEDSQEIPNSNINIPVYGIAVVEFFYLAATLTTLAVIIYSRLQQVYRPIKSTVSYFTQNDLVQKQAVESVLENFIKITGCHRVCIGLFHNGSSVGSTHFKKMSITHEAKQQGVSSFIARFQNVPLYKLEQELTLSNSYEFTSISINDPDLYISCKNYMNSNCLKYVLTRQLICNKGIYGIIELQFIEEPDLDDLKKQETIAQINTVYDQIANMTDYIRRNKPIPLKK